VKSEEELKLEQALFAQAEWKVKFAQGKIKSENIKTKKEVSKKEVKKVAKRRATVPVNFQVLERRS